MRVASGSPLTIIDAPLQHKRDCFEPALKNTALTQPNNATTYQSTPLVKHLLHGKAKMTATCSGKQLTRS
ncbi:hypothetical protein DAI22_10g087800 [Oryza sativa Japonica Group]|nr:hypothetical protein DAI22_10g087800 [Oryza sativa Japonica Group]